jgi:hypothetical protein
MLNQFYSDHLRRLHRRPHQCPRCFIVIPPSALKLHLESEPLCPSVAVNPLGGVGKEHFDDYQQQKKSHEGRHGDRLDREMEWRLFYQALFPNETIPSPCKQSPQPKISTYLLKCLVFLQIPTPSASHDSASVFVVENHPTLIRLLRTYTEQLFRELGYGDNFIQDTTVKSAQIQHNVISQYTYQSPLSNAYASLPPNIDNLGLSTITSSLNHRPSTTPVPSFVPPSAPKSGQNASPTFSAMVHSIARASDSQLTQAAQENGGLLADDFQSTEMFHGRPYDVVLSEFAQDANSELSTLLPLSWEAVPPDIPQDFSWEF